MNWHPTTKPAGSEPDASFIFEPRNDLSLDLMLAMYRMGGKAREDALLAADEHCRRAQTQRKDERK